MELLALLSSSSQSPPPTTTPLLRDVASSAVGFVALLFSSSRALILSLTF
ncbi:hypothetical protein [Rickettsia rickettsii]|nr:hypothetical protein [Rickettsia rickettsii]USD85337.1 hypothetical protein NDY50_06510 [Rickettsia rickettsii]